MQVLANRYHIQRQLGKKAGRQTLLARDFYTQNLVVVKILTFNANFEWDDLRLFEREAATLQSLSHPAIPQYLDYFELDEPDRQGFALVQTHIDALSLENHLKAGRTFSEADVKQIAKNLLDILAYLHDRQPPVIHRDIKPSNILLTNRTGHHPGQVYLVDFGSVQTLTAKEGGTMTIVGTYGYMPPEQFGGRATAASDLYSLGATLIYLSTGHHPAELPHDDLRIEFEAIAAHLSPDFQSWLRQLTEPRPKQRFRSVTQASEALEHPQPLSIIQSPIQPPIQFTTRTQPTDSKIRLIKTKSLFEVNIPPVGAPFAKVVLAIALDLLFLGVLRLLFSQFDIGLLIFVLTSLFWLIGFRLTYRSIIDMFGRFRLTIDTRAVSFTVELLGLKLHRPKPFPKAAIRRLVYIPRHAARDTRGKVVIIPSQILLRFHAFPAYEINAIDLKLTDADMEWLAYELSEWLGLPLDRT
jgi:hypothetical protein